MNQKRYNELLKHYKVSLNNSWVTTIQVDAFDVVLQFCGRGYANEQYRIIKNGPGLSDEDLAIICDRGNLPFGFRRQDDIIIVYID